LHATPPTVCNSDVVIEHHEKRLLHASTDRRAALGNRHACSFTLAGCIYAVLRGLDSSLPSSLAVMCDGDDPDYGYREEQQLEQARSAIGCDAEDAFNETALGAP
jgi:hypothetical protein